MSAGTQLPPRENSNGYAVTLSTLQAVPHIQPQNDDMGCPTLAITQGSTLHILQGSFSTIGHVTKTGIKAGPPYTQKQTQRGCQIEETKKYGPTERTDQNSRKRTKQQEDSQPIRRRVQNTGIRILTEMIEYATK